MTKKLIARSFIHSCFIPKTKNGGDCVTVSEHLHFDDGSHRPNLRVLENPKRTFYVTRKALRAQHTEKKERELIANCDRIIAPNHEWMKHAHRALYGFMPNGYVQRDKILNSPYLYGGSADIQSLIKIKYRRDFEKTGVSLAPITTGMFDTEISLIEGSEGQLLCLTLTHENKVYTAVHRNWMWHNKGPVRERASIEDLKQLSTETLIPIIDELFSKNKNLRKLKDKLPFEFHYFEGRDEIEMLAWMFARLHENQTTFIGIWNLGYDIGQLVRIFNANGCDPADYFSHPDIPDNDKFFNYKEDKKRTAHIADKWHWVNAPSYSQFIDLMAVYNKLRVVDGKESSYALDYILKKNNITGKLKFKGLGKLEDLEGTPDWHREMSTKHFLEYVVYNQWDSIALQCLEWMNGDTFAVRILSDNTAVEKFPRQTVKNGDTLHAEWGEKGWVFGTAGTDMEEDYDEELEAEGGAVLDSFRVDKTGLKVIEEYPQLVSQIHVYVSDVDFSQMYPTVMENANISKETKVSTAFSIFGEHVKIPPGPQSVETFYSYMISAEDNAHNIGRDYFNFPTFKEAEDGYAKERNSGSEYHRQDPFV